MGINLETAKKAEEIAKRIARARGQESLWELYLTEAYNELFNLDRADEGNHE